MSFEDVLRFTNLFSSGIVAGVLAAVLVGGVPALRQLPDTSALAVKQKFDPLIDRVNPPFAVLSLVTGVLVLLFAEDLTDTAKVLLVVGLLGTVGVGLTSLLVNMPINRRMSAWSEGAPPPEYPAVMARWSRMHAVRTASGLIAFAGYVAATIAVIN